MVAYELEIQGTRHCVVAVRPPLFPHKEARRVTVARRDTAVQAQSVLDDCVERDATVERVLAARLLGGNQ
jgi:hypothetical protein